jgi:hypothetical protein
MTAMRTAAQEQVAISIQSIGICCLSPSVDKVLTDSLEPQKGNLAGG